jgi:hypothetical protein
MTYAQLMAATIPELETELARYALPTMPGAVKAQAHLTWRGDYDTWLVAQRGKVQNGFADPPGLETPPPPPNP